MRTSNPLLRADTFDARAATGADTMTIMGTVNKTAMLVAAVFGTAIWSLARTAHRRQPGGVPVGDRRPDRRPRAVAGLLVTLVWLYLEVLRLLAKLNRRD